MHLSDAFGFAIGMALLAVGLYRARVVQSWMAVGVGSIGRMVLRESDEAWEHTPEYEGFRPVPGMR